MVPHRHWWDLVVLGLPLSTSMRMTDEIEVVPLCVVEAKRARRKQVVLARQKGVWLARHWCSHYGRKEPF